MVENGAVIFRDFELMKEQAGFVQFYEAVGMKTCLDPLHSVSARPTVDGTKGSMVYEAVNKESRKNFFIGECCHDVVMTVIMVMVMVGIMNVMVIICIMLQNIILTTCMLLFRNAQRIRWNQSTTRCSIRMFQGSRNRRRIPHCRWTCHLSRSQI